LPPQARDRPLYFCAARGRAARRDLAVSAPTTCQRHTRAAWAMPMVSLTVRVGHGTALLCRMRTPPSSWHPSSIQPTGRRSVLRSVGRAGGTRTSLQGCGYIALQVPVADLLRADYKQYSEGGVGSPAPRALCCRSGISVLGSRPLAASLDGTGGPADLSGGVVVVVGSHRWPTARPPCSSRSPASCSRRYSSLVTDCLCSTGPGAYVPGFDHMHVCTVHGAVYSPRG
jgi:hypothetical protein